MSDWWPSDDLIVADCVRRELVAFVRRFDQRSTDSGALGRILEGESFRGGIVKQAPEFFTEQYLIVPVLNALGYDDIRQRPVELMKHEINQPDLQIDDPPQSIECIVEAKRLNREADDGFGREQIEGYLDDNTFAQYATDRDRKYLAGIATDGVSWALYAKVIGTSESKLIDETSLKPILKALDRDIRGDGDTDSLSATDVRNSLAETIVRSFAKHQLLDAVTEPF